LRISLPEGIVSHTNRMGGNERRMDRRYHVELPVRVAWRDSSGKPREADGLAKDISRSGIYFFVPSTINAEEPVQVDLVLPDEITHQGDMRIHLLAKPVRQERVVNTLREPGAGVAIAAALDESSEEPPIARTTPEREPTTTKSHGR
jgi:hypothetical protein